MGRGRGNFEVMDNLPLYLAGGLPDRAFGLQSITLTRADGTVLEIDPAAARPRFIEEQPDLERMADDWGAVCETFKMSEDTFLTMTGVRLQSGDTLTMRYSQQPALRLRVVEVEGDRARVVTAGDSR